MLDTAAKIFSDAPRDAIVRALGQIEQTGVVIHRGSRLRVQPDLLADHILSSACFDFSLGVPTGYAERVWNHASGSARRNLLVNLGRIDWKLSSEGSLQQSLLDMAWHTLEKDFKESGISARVDLLKLLEKVAFFQPQRTLELIRWALNHELDGGEPNLYRDTVTYNEVCYAAASVLRNVAYHLDHLEETCDILWGLAKDDDRPINQYPDHPVRILQDLISYSRYKPLVWTERVVDRAISWLDDEYPYHLSPFDVLDTALSTEAEDHWADGYKIMYSSFSPLGLGNDNVFDIRSRIVTAVLGQMENPNIFRAARAVKSLGAALSYPFREAGGSERSLWDAEFASILGRIPAEVDLASLDPTITVALREKIDLFTENTTKAIAEAANKVIEQLDQNLDFQIAEALMFGPWRMHRHRRGKEWSEEAEQKWLTDIAIKYSSSVESEQEAAECIERHLKTIFEAGSNVTNNPGPFVSAVVHQRLDIGSGIIERVLSEPRSEERRVGKECRSRWSPYH